MPYDPPPDLAGLSLMEIGAMAQTRKLPPVESWNPERTGDSDMRIAADGCWYHQGGAITRPAMVRAFSSLLRVIDGTHYLVTPQEKLRISVDDAPFIAVELRSESAGKNRRLAMRLNSDDLVVLDKAHGLEMRGALPYLHVRGGLWAKLSRPVYYELAELALAERPNSPGLWSSGYYFPLTQAP
jgi:uncharacterized protein